MLMKKTLIKSKAMHSQVRTYNMLVEGNSVEECEKYRHNKDGDHQEKEYKM